MIELTDESLEELESLGDKVTLIENEGGLEKGRRHREGAQKGGDPICPDTRRHANFLLTVA